MKRLTVVSTLLFAVAPALADELEIGPAELDSLGITFAEPEAAESVEVVEARARVMIPPANEYVVSSALPGLVARVHARLGGQYTKGETLVEVRSAAFLTLQQEYLEALNYGALAAAQLERDRQLSEEGIIPDRRLEETRANAAAAAGRQAEHRQLLGIAGMADADILRLARDKVLQDTLMIRAPVTGSVLGVSAKAGESVDAVEALLRMADVSELWLDIYLPQEFSARVYPGMTVEVPALLGEPVGRIISVGQAVDPATQVVSVLAEVTSPGLGLKPGQLVAVRLVDDTVDGEDPSVWSVPTSALARTGSAAFVFVRTAGGVAAQQVTIIGGTGDRTVVRGLGDGKVAVTGVSALKALWLSSRESDD